VAKDDDEILLPKKKAKSGSSSRGAPSPQMAKLMLGTRVVGTVFGGFVTLVGFMAIVGYVTDNFFARLLVALTFVIGLPAFLSDRLLKRTNLGGGLTMVADVFAIVLLGLALMFVAADVVTKGMFAKEGDRYARSGSRTMARIVYYVAGVAPVFPDEKEGAKAPGAASASSSAAPKGSPR
jgi:hypothetical protein